MQRVHARWNLTDVSVWTDEAGEADDSSIGKELGHFGDTSDVLLSIFVTESEVLVQSMPNVITVQTVGWNALADKKLLEGERDRCLTSAGETCAQETESSAALTL